MSNQSTHIENFKKYPIRLLFEKSDSVAPLCTPLDEPKSGTFIMEEIWKEIKGFEGLYWISNLGRVYSKKRTTTKGGILKTNISIHGYKLIMLWRNKKGYVKSIHRLVAETFISNPLNKLTINHKNGIKTDNNVKNLEWMTNKENSIHARDVLKKHFGHGDKAIIGISLKTGKIIRFCSFGEAGRNGFDGQNIWACCNKRLNQHKGYKWQYDTENL